MRRLAVVALVASLTSCGLPSHEIQRLAPQHVPFGLLATAPPSASPQGQGPRSTVYLIDRTRLAPRLRRVVGANVPAEAVRALLLGPTPSEAAAGVATDIPAQTRLISLDVKRSVATVDLSSEFGTVGGSEQVLAVAQLVFTLTNSPYISSVRFAINGRRIEVPDATGSLSAGPRTRNDYLTLAPPG